jgi:hypothetical protein
MIGFTGWFNSFKINNWHGSLRKMKNCNKGKSGRRNFLDHCLAEKECAFFSAQGMLQKMYGKGQNQEEEQNGLIAKIYANNLCQRKLF